MDLDSFVLTIKSVNFLSNSPSARVEEVEELIQGPFGFTPEEGLELLDYPDLDAIRKRKTAKRRWVESCLDKIIEAEDPDAPGVYTMPEPPMDLQLAYDLAHETYQDMRTRGNVNERTMARILDFALDAKNELDKANAAAAPPPMPGAPPGPGAGEPLPAEQPMAPQPGLPPMGGG